MGNLVVDECHHVSKLSGHYTKILEYILAPVRLGLTATKNRSEEGIAAVKGLLGPEIGKTSYLELQEGGHLAKPKIKLYRVPEMSSARKRKLRGKYPEVYQEGIVDNRKRNMLIVNKASEQIEAGKL
ncbi:MAG: DEAD/DEAH box helicase family protein, partial [Gammaproteobacteria bacterium]|nr:DEAD/DEAH box helicase family protein [Gammaproteobacteria bacterium]